MENTVKWVDFISGKCQFGGCVHNAEGFCENDDDIFLAEQMSDMLERGNTEGEFECSGQEVDDKNCEWCGEEFSEQEELVGEFWGAPAYQKVVYCSNCE